jgi:ureidoacrylate peracid hydrolase
MSRTIRLDARPEAVEISLARTALLVVDMQNAYCSPGGYLDLAGFDLAGIDEVIRRAGEVIEAARHARLPIFYLQNGWDPLYREAGGPRSPNQQKSNALKTMRARPELWGQLMTKGTWDYALIDAISPGPEDIVVSKARYSGFVGTALDSMLRSRDISSLLVIGVATNVCVESTVRDAFGHEYSAIVISDCTFPAGPDSIFEASLFNIERFFGWVTGSSSVLKALSEAAGPDHSQLDTDKGAVASGVHAETVGRRNASTGT